MNMLFWRALLAFLVLPGMVAFAIPLSLFELRSHESWVWIGFIPLLAGIVLLLWCVREFYVAGRGTLAPWEPPQNLVVTGLYRFSRNPMYVAVALILIGWALVFYSWMLAIYTGVIGIGFHLRVILGEEPWLAQTFGAEWSRYKAQVPRWFGFRTRAQEMERVSD